jgi:hypothetical protein
VPIINLDNCSDDLGGNLLCQITEQRYVLIRILGKSETPQCEYRGSVYATGNNITYVGDMTRRGLTCNLDAVLEQPETRTFPFDPVKRAAEHRGQYIHDVLTISRAYRAAGCPRPAGCGPIGSYGAWSTAVREPLIWLGRSDPIASMDTLREEDPARIAARRLTALHAELPSSFTVAELAQLAERMTSTSKGDGFGTTSEYTHPELRELLIQQAGNFKGSIDTRKLSRWLTSILRQIHDGFRLVLVRESKGHGNRYSIEPATAGGDAQQPTPKTDLKEETSEKEKVATWAQTIEAARGKRDLDAVLGSLFGDDEREARAEAWRKISDAKGDFNKRFTLGDLRHQRPGLADQLEKAEREYWSAEGAKKREAGEKLAETWREIVTALNEDIFNRGGGPKKG